MLASSGPQPEAFTMTAGAARSEGDDVSQHAARADAQSFLEPSGDDVLPCASLVLIPRDLVDRLSRPQCRTPRPVALGLSRLSCKGRPS